MVLFEAGGDDADDIAAVPFFTGLASEIRGYNGTISSGTTRTQSNNNATASTFPTRMACGIRE